MPRLSLALLGAPTILLDGAEVADFGYAKVRALLIYLAAEPGRAHGREALAELLWPEQPPQVGRASLRQALARLRQALGEPGGGPPLLLVDRDTVRLDPAGDIAVDALAFAELVTDGPRHGHGAGEACPACVASWERAVAMYRGPFADGAVPRDARGFEEWAALRREWFEARQLATLARLAAHAAARGDHAAALDYARRELAIDPLREAAHRAAMAALAALGDRAAALAQYERCRRTLAEELGVAPDEETERLRQAIRAGEVEPAAPPPPRADEPPPAPLPAQPTSFIGRAADLRNLLGLLDDPERRLITLLGPGGVGKTRLAHRLAETAAPHYGHGARWVALAHLRSPDELPDAVARALGCAHDDSGDARARLREHLQPRELLLVLDNFEHVLGGAALLSELLAAAPRLTVVVTSRERLQLRAEWVYELDGLGLAAAPGAPAEAVELLLERARQVARIDPLAPDELAAAERIAALVEGLPLALELAAATRRTRPFAAIAAALERDLDLLRSSLRDLPERHRSVRATFEYSWRLLDAAERAAMARLSLFRGGFSPAAAAAVADADEAALEALADKSMLRRAGERLDMHELVRRYAAEALAAGDDGPAAEAAHLDWALALAAQAERGMVGPEQELWLARLEAEHANLRAALTRAIEGRHAAEAQELAASLTRFWWMRGHMAEGRGWLERALALGGDDPGPRARALHGAGGLANQLGDLAPARALLEESLALERALGRQAELSRVLNNLALVYLNQGAYEPARALIEEALVIDRGLGDERGVAFSFGTLGEIAYVQGDYQRSAELYAQSLELHRRARDEHSVAVTLVNLGVTLYAQGRLGEARPLLEEGLGRFRALGAAFGEAYCLVRLARIALAAGDQAAALTYGRQAVPMLADLGHLGELGLCLMSLARLALAAGDAARAGRLWGAADGLLAAPGASVTADDRAEYDKLLAEARAAADRPAWEAAWDEGRALSLAEAVALTLA